MKKTDFKNLFESFKSLRVGVVGDLMLDTYWVGKVERISPEAPVPIVSISGKEQRIGGAGNVALNLAGFNLTVHALGVIGKDEEGEHLDKLLSANHIGTEFLVKSADRPTSNKIRIIGRNQQMMRLDSEITQNLNKQETTEVLAAFNRYMDIVKPHLLIFEDYNKGVLTEEVITYCIARCKKEGVITTVDPKRKNFFAYKGVDMFKPNLQEARDGLNLPYEDINAAVLHEMHKLLNQKLGNKISLITLSERGIFYEAENESRIIPTHVRKIADVSGAGDTVIAVASIVYASTGNVSLMAEMANIAGGMVCEEVGTVAIQPLKLQKECETLLNGTIN